MATSEQRKEIAEKLRETKEECNQRGYPWMVEDLMRALGFLSYEDADDQIFDRLADLIDPTCEMEVAGDVPDVVKKNLTTWFCSECGSPIYNDMSPSYCPYCGARMVSDDEQ